MQIAKLASRSLVAVLVCGVLTAPAVTAQMPDGASEEQQALYALGVAISKQVATFSLSDAELDLVVKGLKDGAAGKEGEIDLQSLMPKINELAQSRAKQVAAKEREAGAAFFSEMAEKAKADGGVVTDSGLLYIETKAGEGASPQATDKVKVHYHGTLRSGEVFDSSVDRGQPASFGLNQVIPCWTEGVQKMKVGGKAKLVCPPDIAYGERAAGKIPPGATLVFEVELLEIEGNPAG